MNAQKTGTAHTFFLYLPPHLTPRTLGVSSNVFTVKDKALTQRVHHVLRLRTGDEVQFFTGIQVITVALTSGAQSKDTLSGTVVGFYDVAPRPRNLMAGIGLLKKDALEAAVYSAAQMGAQVITPIITAKSRSAYMNDKEPARLEKMIIAACEQSKNAHIPKLAAPVTTEQFLNRYKKHDLICFDATGTPLTQLTTTLEKSDRDACVLIGPEGGFIPDELKAIADGGALTAQLTKTILRSRDAACLGLGVVSSVVL